MNGHVDEFKSNTEKKHDNVAMILKKSSGENTRATALVSMTKEEKERLTMKAKEHGLSLSAFFRLATDEYMRNHNW